jgi:hypothetical protein
MVGEIRKMQKEAGEDMTILGMGVYEKMMRMPACLSF